MKNIKINNFETGNALPLTIIAGPCVIESRDLILHTAEKIKNLSVKTGINFVFKSSYKKANRTSGNSFKGLGDDEALQILAEAGREFQLSILTDIHSPEEAIKAAQVADILQIPAFLCRQSELLEAAAKTGKIVNIKKGQFLAPEDMTYAAQKCINAGNQNIMLTERGTSFGYHNLVVDMRGLVIMKKSGFPVIMDATHSVQIPSINGISGGDREFILPLAKAAVSIGIAGVFLETHPDPDKAFSDAGSQLPLGQLEAVVNTLMKIDRLVKSE